MSVHQRTNTSQEDSGYKINVPSEERLQVEFTFLYSSFET